MQLSQPHLRPVMQYVNWPFAPHFPFRNKSKQDFRFNNTFDKHSDLQLLVCMGLVKSVRFERISKVIGIGNTYGQGM